MPQPDRADLHVDALLTNLSIAYMNDPSNYIADKLFPIVPVRKQSDILPKYDKEAWFRDEAKLRSPGTETEGTGYTVDLTEKYFCLNYAIHKDIPDEVRDNADQPFNPDAEATRLVTDKILMRREKNWASNFFKTGVWGNSVTPANLWDDYALSDPISDIETAKDTIYLATAKDPKTFVLGRQVWTKFKHHPDFLERIKYTQRAVLTTDLIASMMDLDNIFIGQALENTADEGQTAVMAMIFGKNALLMYVTGAPALLTPSAGYTFHWNRRGGLSFIRRVRDDKAQYDRIECHTYFDQKAVVTDCGYCFVGIVS